MSDQNFERHSDYAAMQVARTWAKAMFRAQVIVAVGSGVGLLLLILFVNPLYAWFAPLPIAIAGFAFRTLASIKLSQSLETKMRSNDRAGISNRKFSVVGLIALAAILLYVVRQPLVSALSHGVDGLDLFLIMMILSLVGFLLLKAIKKPTRVERTEKEELMVAKIRTREASRLNYLLLAFAVIIPVGARYLGKALPTLMATALGN